MSSGREKKAVKEYKEREEEGGKRTHTIKDKETIKTKRKESGF